METLAIQDHRYDIFTSSFQNLEFSDDHKRAILLLPLMHVGPNKKGLYWTAKMLKNIAPMFRSVPFRYDLEGQEGSSHTINKLSSPHFDVGWTYSSEDGGWYDDKTKTLWVKGEVTHPDVIAKLERITTDGKREVNYGSMGVIVEDAKCSICGSDFLGNVCENDHERNKKYDGKTCYKVPTKVSKALHAALTNDPADGEAEIKNVLVQELGEYDSAPQGIREQAGDSMERTELSNQTPGGLAPSSPQTAQPGMAPSPETIMKDLAERVKTIEQKVSASALQNGTPELVNSAPQDQFIQSNMGTTTQFEAQKQPQEVSTMGKDVMAEDVSKGQSDNAKTPVNSDPKEYQDGMGDPMQQVMNMLQQILQRLPGAEMQDMGKESLDVNKSQAKSAQADIPVDHVGSGDQVSDNTDESNKKNKENMQKPGMVATADSAEERPEEKPADELKEEVADLQKQMKVLRGKLEISDNKEISEFGGNTVTKPIEIADLGAAGRTEKFGEFGAWDSIFNGADSAQKFAR